MARGSAADNPRRTIRLLGPVEVAVAGTSLAVDTRKATGVLAFLAVRGQPASREALAALLWPESGGTAARGALRRTLSVLNAALRGRGLSISRSSVALEGGWDVDLVRFRALLATARAHDHAADVGCAGCRSALEAAVALDRGEFMAGFSLRDSAAFEEWQLAEAENHRRDLAGLFERLVPVRVAAGDTAGAIAACRRWLELDPLHEPAHRALMRILSAAGESAAAVRQYRACVRILDEELGVAPLDETTELYEAIRSGEITAGSRSPVPPPVEPEPPRGVPLIGRETQLRRLVDGYRAIGPDGRLFVIEGEPGVGKTRLASALVDEVRKLGGRVLAARAYAGVSSIPFGPIGALVAAGLERPDAAGVIEALDPATVAAAARLAPAMSRFRPTRDVVTQPLDAIGRARAIESVVEVLTALAADSAPGLLAVDDAHWADDSSVDVLAFLARRLEGRRIGLVLTWRPPGSDAELRRLPSIAVHDRRLTFEALDRFGRKELTELSQLVLGASADEAFVDRLYAESEGLPLYVVEVLAAGPGGDLGVPRQVLELIRARIAAVSEIGRQVLAAASVVGRSFDFEIVRIASGRSEDETVAGLEELVARGLVREVGAVAGDVRLDFTHGRLRDVVHASLGLVRRRLLHRRVADALRARSSSDDLARWSQIAHHEERAGRPAEAADAHRRAAAYARAVFANAEAREHLESALAMGAAPPSEVHEELGEVLTLLGDYAGAIAHLEAAAATAESSRASTIERALALVHARRGDWSRAASHISAALDLAGPDSPARAALLADRSAIAGRRGDRPAAEAAGSEALAVAEASGDQEGIARACHVLAVLARSSGSLDAAAALLERALAASEALPDPTLRIASLNTLALVRGAQGDRPAAIALVRDALALCERQGDRHRQAALENNLADLLRADGRRDEAMDHLKTAVAIFADIGGQGGVPEPEIWKLVEW
jgi:DNA-binding SARP family transcriptional activator/predicted ATPase